MKSSRKIKKQGEKQNELIISDDIDTTESFVGLGKQNIVNNADNLEIAASNFECQNNNIKRNLPVKSGNYENNCFSDFKVSPELSFNLPINSDSNNALRKSPGVVKNSKLSSAKSSGIKSSANVTSLPILNLKNDKQSDIKSKSINDQIVKIEHRKQNLSISEKKSRMKEVMKKGKQNWSNFKADIDFIKSIESNSLIVPSESANMIKDEKALNRILNELSCLETEIVDCNTSTENVDLALDGITDSTNLTEVDQQEHELEFRSTIKPMLKSYIANPMNEDVAMSLKNIIFNSTCRSWGVEWYRQNFEFHPIDSELPFGMIQRTEGPNSVLCVIQAEFLIEALFHCDATVNWMCNIRRNRNRLLAITLARIISRCRNTTNDTLSICLLDVKLKGRTIGSVKCDGITECITVYQMSKKEELQEFILHHISQFADKFSPGLILLVVSCLLTRGIPQCMQELNNNDTRLVSPLGYPRQELMNLLMFGSITSHYFNDTAQIIDDSGNYTTLRGVPSRSGVGFLTTDLHCQHCKEIGTYLKTPTYPVWLAKLDDTNYSVLYCLNGSLVSDWKTEIKFQLNLYSPLFAQKGVVTMTIDSSVTQTEKYRLMEEEKKRDHEKERRNQEVTDKRLKNMSDSALKFILDDQSLEDYLNGNITACQTQMELNCIEKIIYLKWPNAHVLLTDERGDIFSLFKN